MRSINRNPLYCCSDALLAPILGADCHPKDGSPFELEFLDDAEF